MYRVFVLLAVSVALAWSQRSTPTPYNTLVWTDTLRIDSTETEYTQIFWQDNGGEKCLLVEGLDTATAGFASDSACVGITLYQVFNIAGGVVVKLNSKAHPDSTTYPGSSVWPLWDSLNVATMCDTSAARVMRRNAVKYSRLGTGDTAQVYGDDLSSNLTGYGGFAYIGLAPDASPGISLKVVGKATNAKRGSGSRWVFRLYQINGQPVRTK